ncbi:YbhB/YbcL family Raf kinase inhibitor-like protein [Sphingobium sp. HWE2-09]|uniref:YbhB/YbcL family Raf kinase inhibitor-like protein n=1 Tax=Sphingobium sp. HWE2-09 TaxID=3108390 RepID=UPI002DD19C64|nr:YbhB/YbcL family Raf kinase inhibitor-like protein [Sphingobium sp. HWE2-09]
MLEHVPAWMGKLFSNVRAGHEKLSIVKAGVSVNTPMIDLSSTAFAAGGRLPDRFTADGSGMSPPLLWAALPEGTTRLALIVEDPDAPAPNPLVHAIVQNMPADQGRIGEGEIAEDSLLADLVGRNSYGARAWLPPDPPTGHGNHDYVFQLFALSAPVETGDDPGRSDLIEAMTSKVLGAGVLVGTYSRGEAAPSEPVAAALAPE